MLWFSSSSLHISAKMECVVLMALIILPTVTFTSELTCSTFPPKTMKFALQSRRNETGHWTAKFKLQHDGRNTIENSIWDIDMQQNIVSCGGVDIVDIQATLTAPLEAPGPGYELFPNMGYYKFHDSGLIWQDALRACTQEGAHLAIINSEAESSLIKKLYARYPKIQNTIDGKYAFIGYHDFYKEGKFETIFGQPLESTGFTTFMKGQPNNAPVGENKEQNCGGVNRDGLLNDLPCIALYGFICERELLQ